MQIDRHAFLLLTAALSACHARSEARPTKVVPDPSASATAAAKPASLCVELAKANEAESTRAPGPCVAEPNQAFPLQGTDADARRNFRDALGDGTFPCEQGDHGGWGLAIHDARLAAPAWEGQPRCGWVAQSDLVFQATDGARSRIAYAPIESNGPRTHVKLRALYDFDGDGRAEAIVEHAPLDLGGCDHELTLRVLQATAGGVRDYPVGAPFTDVVDVDEDGRPDLVDDRHWLGDSGEGMCGAHDVTGPAVLLHALPNGTFSRDDAVARAFARVQCPSKPKAPHEDVGCARVWGETEAAALADVEPYYAKHPAEAAFHLAAARAFAKIAPPFAPLSRDPPAPLPKLSPRPRSG